MRCPACGGQYTYNHGKVRIRYFKHINMECNEFSEPETEEHITGKQALYKWLLNQNGVSDVVLEGWIKSTKQRPDIMFKYFGQPCVMEYQCSPISSEYIDRHNLYNNAGIIDIWICGTKKYIQFYHTGKGRKRVSKLESEAKLYYNSETKQMYIIDTTINRKTFDRYERRKNIWNNEQIMRNPYDYRIGKNNYIFVKDWSQSYRSYNYYPSPTGRSSNKYPHPILRYNYFGNSSIAKCIPINMLKLTNIH